jgi:hypothetical protein
VLNVDTTFAQLHERSTAFVCSSSAAAALVTVSGGMMDIGWAEAAAPSLQSIVDAHVQRGHASGGVDALALAFSLETQLTELEHREKWLCSVGLVLIERSPSAQWRIARIGGARVYAVRGSDVSIVGREDALALPHTGDWITTAGLTSSVRWRSEPHGWVLDDDSETARQQRALVRTDVVEAADAIVVVTCPHWSSLDAKAVVRACDPAHPQASASIAALVDTTRPACAVMVVR